MKGVERYHRELFPGGDVMDPIGIAPIRRARWRWTIASERVAELSVLLAPLPRIPVPPFGLGHTLRLLRRRRSRTPSASARTPGV